MDIFSPKKTPHTRIDVLLPPAAARSYVDRSRPIISPPLQLRQGTHRVILLRRRDELSRLSSTPPRLQPL